MQYTILGEDKGCPMLKGFMGLRYCFYRVFGVRVPADYADQGADTQIFSAISNLSAYLRAHLRSSAGTLRQYKGREALTIVNV